MAAQWYGRLASGAIVDIVELEPAGTVPRYAIRDGEPLARHPDDKDGTLFLSIIHRRAIRLFRGEPEG